MRKTITALAILQTGCYMTGPSRIELPDFRNNRPTCQISLDTNVQGMNSSKGIWVKAMLMPSEAGACGTGCGEVGCPSWTISGNPVYQICPTHADAIAGPCNSSTGKYLHIFSPSGTYQVEANMNGNVVNIGVSF